MRIPLIISKVATNQSRKSLSHLDREYAGEYECFVYSREIETERICDGE